MNYPQARRVLFGAKTKPHKGVVFLLRIVDNVRTIIQRQNEYIYIPDLSPQGQI